MPITMSKNEQLISQNVCLICILMNFSGIHKSSRFEIFGIDSFDRGEAMSSSLMYFIILINFFCSLYRYHLELNFVYVNFV